MGDCTAQFIGRALLSVITCYSRQYLDDRQYHRGSFAWAYYLANVTTIVVKSVVIHTYKYSDNAHGDIKYGALAITTRVCQSLAGASSFDIINDDSICQSAVTKNDTDIVYFANGWPLCERCLVAVS